MYISILSDYPCLEVALACVCARDDVVDDVCRVCAHSMRARGRLRRRVSSRALSTGLLRYTCARALLVVRVVSSYRRELCVVPPIYRTTRRCVVRCGVVGRGMRETSRPVRRGLVSFFYKSKLRLNLGNRVEARTQCCPSDEELQVVQVARTVELLSNHQKFIQSPKH